MQFSKKSGKRPETFIETHNFKILLLLLHGYYTAQLKNIAILVIGFAPHNFKILSTCRIEFFWISNPT